LALRGVQGELGNVSVRLADAFKAKEGQAKTFVERLFPEYRQSVRTKGANSICSKLERQVSSKKKDIKIECDSQAKSLIGDAIGARVFMPSLSKADIQDVLSTCKLNLHIPGQGLISLTEKEQKILTKIFSGQRVSETDKKLVEHLINPVKIKLAEKQSQPVVNRLLASSYQYALDKKQISLKQMEELVKKGELSKDVFDTVKKNYDMKELLEASSPQEIRQMVKNGEITEAYAKEILEYKPFDGINITRFNNYRGSDGVAYFSDAQIQQIKRMQVQTGNYFSIASVSEHLTSVDAKVTAKKVTRLKEVQARIEKLSQQGGNEKEISELQKEFETLQKKYGLAGIDTGALDKGAIKGSGYTTTQMNFTMADGTQGELQLRGEGFFAEIEHIAYDARQGKNTLGVAYQEYVRTVKGLSEKQYDSYNRYIKECYNYTRNLELGIQTPTPKLPKGLPSILSQRSMENLHDINAQMEAAAKEAFTPHLKMAV
jgi:DNA-binding transcriptional MerR regulator